jgi:hypothetical protein
MSGRLARLALWSALGVALAVAGYLLINTTFMPYDDEGFLLISLRNYLAGLRLYDDVFSQYGPWPYVYHQIVTTLLGGAPLTHTLGRALTLLHWVTMALLCGALAWRLARSQVAAVAAAIIAFGLTWQMVSEPSHPGSLISLLVAIAGLVITTLPGARRPALVYAALGIITACLLFTKVNVGLLMAAGVAAYALRFTPWPPAWRGLAWLGPALLLAPPWVLLKSQLSHGWAVALALQFTLAVAGMLWVTGPKTNAARLPARAWLAAPLAALATLGAVAGWIFLHGTTPAALFETVLLGPLRMPSNYVVGVAFYPETWAFTATGALAVAKAGWELRRDGRLAASTVWFIAGLRIAAFALFLFHVESWPSYFGIFHFVVDCLPLFAVFLVPLGGARPGADRLAWWGAAAVALPQVLHVFPVAGSQAGWASFLCVPLFVGGLWELGEILPARLGATGRRLAQAGGLLLTAASTGLLALLLFTGWQRYSTSRPLDLPGAEDLRLGGPARQAFRLLSLNAAIHADLLVTRPGMYSYNLWSGVPAPTAQNATHWAWLLNATLQQARVDQLRATPRTALISSRSLEAYLVEHKIPGGGPLWDFLPGHYRELFRYGDFSFFVPRDSEAIPFGRFELRESASPDPAVPPLLFRTSILLDGHPAAIRLEEIEYPWREGPELLTAAAQAVAEPIDRAGRPRGPAVALPSAQPLRGLYRLTLVAPRLPAGLVWQNYALVVRDEQGRLLSESAH